MSDGIRYGYYLRPSPEMCAAQVRMHELLEHQFGLEVAGKFMPHATIKGFFKSSAPVEEIRAAASGITEGMASFSVLNNGVIGFGETSIVIGIMRNLDGSKNQLLLELHQRALDALMPLVDPDCNFSFSESHREQFEAHLTLAMADLKPEFFEEVLTFCQQLAPIGPATFLAERLHLHEFRSDDWHGCWGDSLTWKMLDSWGLR